METGYTGLPKSWIWEWVLFTSMVIFFEDIMNFRLAKILAEAEGLAVEEIIAFDDIASAPKEGLEIEGP